MRKISPGFVCLALLGLLAACEEKTHAPEGPGPIGWDLQIDAMSLAILVLDYNSYTLEGGHLSFHSLCGDCDLDRLPIFTDFHPPGDFGGVELRYEATGDTLFAATIIWMGRGQITHPGEFTPPDSFQVLPGAARRPDNFHRFPVWPQLEEPDLAARIDAAWEAVAGLDITHAFAASERFQAGFYLYPPTVGGFAPNLAKWIVLLYRGNAY